MEPDRKTLIADAAMAILGTQGARALTHRAVDAQAGLPAGSTSFYCRTRLELLKLTLARHVALDDALEAGSEFIVSPGLTDRLAQAARHVPFLPGIATAGASSSTMAAAARIQTPSRTSGRTRPNGQATRSVA